jgi:urea carboxylase
VWNTHRITPEFDADKPWLLRFFDQIRFFPMSADDLLAFRDGFLQGKVGLKIEPTTFKLSDYRRFLADNATDITAFKASQQTAFEEERSRWQAGDQSGAVASDAASDAAVEDALPDNAVPVASPVPGAVWKIEVTKGARVKEGDILVVVESMKMEMSVHAPASGIVTEVRCAEGRPVALGQTLIVLIEDAAEAAQ